MGRDAGVLLARLRALLEGDLLYRAKRLALAGADGLFGDLHPSVSWKDGVLSVDKRVDLDVEPGDADSC